MKTVISLDVYSDYYYYDDGTETRRAARMKWPTDKELPLLHPGISIQVGNVSYRVAEVIAISEHKQSATCRTNIGYNRNRKEQLKRLQKRGWILEKEYD